MGCVLSHPRPPIVSQVCCIKRVEGGVQVEATCRGVPSTFHADVLICSLPLGVLKSDAVTFDPPLPPRKRQAIERLGFGTLNKVP